MTVTITATGHYPYPNLDGVTASLVETVKSDMTCRGFTDVTVVQVQTQGTETK